MFLFTLLLWQFYFWLVNWTGNTRSLSGNQTDNKAGIGQAVPEWLLIGS